MSGVVGLAAYLVSSQVVYVTEPGKRISSATNLPEIGLDSLESSSLTVAQPYRVIFSPPLEPSLLKEFTSRSLLLQSDPRTISSQAEAERRAKEDLVQLRTVCERAGYFDADLTFTVTATETEILIQYTVQLGQRYQVRKKMVQKNDNSPVALPDRLPVQESEAVDFAHVLKDQQFLRKQLQNRGVYFAHLGDAVVTLDRITKQADILYPVSKAFLVKVDTVQVVGAGDIPQKWILKRAVLREGALLTLADVTESQEGLLESGLFSSLEVRAEENKNFSVSVAAKNKGTQQGQSATGLPLRELPATVTLDVKPLPPRTIGLGAYISASEGPFATLLWRHKNVLKKAWTMGLLAQGGLKEVSSQVFWDIPDLFARYQKFHSDVTFLHMSTPAYKGHRFSASCGLVQTKAFRKARLTWSLLPTLEKGTVSRDSAYESWWIGLPITFKIHAMNHRFTPTSGVGLDISCSPYHGSVWFGSSDSTVSRSPAKTTFMTILKGKLRGYISVPAADSSSNAHGLAAFVSAGSILMNDLSLLPYDKRFYGGGRSSLRSYGYQLGSRLDEKDRPMGGASILEACLEPRIRLSEDFGMVLFVETCCTSDRKWVRFDKDDTKLVGVGLGFRYFTRFGPIRFDLGFPTQRRDSQQHPGKKSDRAVQFYLSVGQCF